MKTTRRWKAWIAVAVTLCAAVVVAANARSKSHDKADGALEFTVERKALDIEVIETGKVEARERVEIKSKIAGQVMDVLVEEGDCVQKGQLLLRLDPIDVTREVDAAKASVTLAKSALDFATIHFKRKKQALQDQGVSRADVDMADAEVRAKQAEVRLAQVRLASATDRLRYSRIESPMAGCVIQKGIRPGEVVVPGIQATFEGKPLLTIADLSTLVVHAELNQIDVAKVAIGHDVAVRFDGLPGRSYDARVTKVAPASTRPRDKTIDVFPIQATLLAADPTIKPGMTADIRIRVDRRADALFVPHEAIVKKDGKAFVTRVTVEDGKRRTSKSEVTLGAENDHAVEIRDGIAEGDRLLIDPASADKNEVKL